MTKAQHEYADNEYDDGKLYSNIGNLKIIPLYNCSPLTHCLYLHTNHTVWWLGRKIGYLIIIIIICDEVPKKQIEILSVSPKINTESRLDIYLSQYRYLVVSTSV